MVEESLNKSESINLKKIGNVEFVECFLTLHCKKYDDLLKNEFSDNPNTSDWEDTFKRCIKNGYIPDINDFETLYPIFWEEAGNRGLDIKKLSPIQTVIWGDEFRNWMSKMDKSPIYVREIHDTDFYGDDKIERVNSFDLPVIEACKILADKGYITYWSSANKEDVDGRKGNIVENKSVAYILIDSENLSEKLKEQLFLNGKNKFWGLAIAHNDNGKYYGIWSEVSLDTSCIDLSKELSKKAFELPDLINKNLK